MKEYKENWSFGWKSCFKNCLSNSIIITNPNELRTFSDFVDLDADNKWNELTGL